MRLLNPGSHRGTTSRRDAPHQSRPDRPSTHHESSMDHEPSRSDLGNQSCRKSARRAEIATNDTDCGLNCQLPVVQPCTCSIAMEVKKRWASSGYAALKAIDCQCVNGVIFISGVVCSYYYKQMAQEVVRGVSGVCRIVNELTVTERNETRTNA